jgi:DNA polymerase/3'-5' exonuclease PolX
MDGRVIIQKMNAVIATRLEEVADILEAQQANPYRVQAYRRAATTVRNCDRPMDEIVREEGVEGLQRLPGIGESLSRTIHQFVTRAGCRCSNDCEARAIRCRFSPPYLASVKGWPNAYTSTWV